MDENRTSSDKKTDIKTQINYIFVPMFSTSFSFARPTLNPPLNKYISIPNAKVTLQRQVELTERFVFPSYRIVYSPYEVITSEAAWKTAVIIITC